MASFSMSLDRQCLCPLVDAVVAAAVVNAVAAAVVVDAIAAAGDDDCFCCSNQILKLLVEFAFLRNVKLLEMSSSDGS